MPLEVVISVSTDGEEFREVARSKFSIAEDTEEITVFGYLNDIDDTAARYVRIHAKNFGTIPEWHPGRGGGAFIFIDEIKVYLQSD